MKEYHIDKGPFIKSENETHVNIFFLGINFGVPKSEILYLKDFLNWKVRVG